MIIARNKVSRRVDVGVEISNVESLVLVVEVAVAAVSLVAVVDDEWFVTAFVVTSFFVCVRFCKNAKLQKK